MTCDPEVQASNIPKTTKKHHSGQIIIFHQPRFPWNKGISLTKPPFGVRSCEVAIIWPEPLDSDHPCNRYRIVANKSLYEVHWCILSSNCQGAVAHRETARDGGSDTLHLTRVNTSHRDVLQWSARRMANQDQSTVNQCFGRRLDIGIIMNHYKDPLIDQPVELIILNQQGQNSSFRLSRSAEGSLKWNAFRILQNDSTLRLMHERMNQTTYSRYIS